MKLHGIAAIFAAGLFATPALCRDDKAFAALKAQVETLTGALEDMKRDHDDLKGQVAASTGAGRVEPRRSGGATIKKKLNQASASATFSRASDGDGASPQGRQLEATGSITGGVNTDETVISPNFVSSSLINASTVVLSGSDMGSTLDDYATRLNMLDNYLQTADGPHYYLYYFGMVLEDGGRALNQGGVYTSMLRAHDVTTATIGGSVYAFVTGLGSDAVTVVDASDLDGTVGSNLPLVAVINAASISEIGTNLNGPIHVTHALIDGSDYIFVACVDSDGVMTFNVSDPSNPTYVAYIDDSDADYDKLGQPWGGLLVHQSGEKWY